MSEKTGLLSRKQARVLCGDGQSFSSFQQLARGHPPRGNDVHPLSIVEIERLHISTSRRWLRMGLTRVSSRFSTLFASSATTLFTQARLISVTIAPLPRCCLGF